MNKWLTLLLAIALLSCRKQRPDPYTPATHPVYSNATLKKFAGYRLFTIRGEITDALLVQKYATEFSNYFYTPGSTFNNPSFQKLALVNDDSLWNLGTVPVGELKRRSQGEYDRFTSLQWMPVNDTNNLLLHLMKYKVYEPQQTPLGLPYLKMYTPHVIVKHVADTLFMPVNKFVLVSRNTNSVSFAADQFNNVLDTTGVSKLGANDTLLIQRFDVALVKEK